MLVCRRAVAPGSPGSILGDALPVAGQDGTLAERFVGTPGEGAIRAKTGSLNDVTSLAGIVETEQGETLQFAYMVNLIGNSTIDQALIDRQEVLGEALVRYPAGPSLEEVAPAGASALAAEALGIDAESIVDGVEIEAAPTVDPASIPVPEPEPTNEAIERLREVLGDPEG